MVKEENINGERGKYKRNKIRGSKNQKCRGLIGGRLQEKGLAQLYES